MKTRRARIALAAVATAAAAAAALALFATRDSGTGQAAAQPSARVSCPKTLLGDWSDGRIDHDYPIACYRAALRSLPADLKVYSSAPDDIAQALSRRIQGAGKQRATRELTR